MSRGTLEVQLLSARGIKHGDLFSKTDAYAIINCGNQSQKSNVARNQGSKPTWNQNFVFPLEEGVSEITLKIMDEDLITQDDELGTVKVPLQNVFQLGKTAATSYNVVTSSGKFKGEVRLSLTFSPKLQLPERLTGMQYPAPINHEVHYVPQGPYGGSHSNDGPYGSTSAGGWNEGPF